jgi:hypothetical protein
MFLLLLFRSIFVINNYQSYLNDMARLEQLNEETYDSDLLTVNAFDLALIKEHLSSLNQEGYLNTESRNTAFFFDIETNIILFHSIHEIINLAMEDPLQTIDGTDYRLQRTPEGLFKDSLIYLGKNDDLLSNAISLVRSTAKPNSHFDDYYDFLTSIKEKNSVFTIFDQNNAEVYEAAAIVLNRFHPKKTLYVNDLGWKTAASNLETIEQIVFDERIEIIPAFNVTGLSGTEHDKIRFFELNIPASVKRIETGALPDDFFDILTLNINNPNNLYLENESLTGVQEIVYNIPLFQYDDMIDFSDHVTIEVSPTGNINYTFDTMTPYILQYGLNGFKIEESNGIVIITFFANEFPIGFARNVYITTCYINPDDRHPYHVAISNDVIFKGVEAPNLPNHTFDGWEYGSMEFEDGDELPSSAVEIYAKWVNPS